MMSCSVGVRVCAISISIAESQHTRSLPREWGQSAVRESRVIKEAKTLVINHLDAHLSRCFFCIDHLTAQRRPREKHTTPTICGWQGLFSL
jgi:hypothetical protein